MCLAVPGRVLDITGDDPLTRTARVDFGGVVKTVNLAFVGDCAVDDHVLVHVGVAIGKVDAVEARKTHELLDELMSSDQPELPS